MAWLNTSPKLRSIRSLANPYALTIDPAGGSTAMPRMGLTT